MTVYPYILATAGHVDHGKSTLVRALTGVDPDRLPEEKSRGITIDLGFAPLQLPHPADPAASLRVGIIDVPGHEDFVTTMAAGTGAADAALLVIAANEGWMPQTQEHIEILQYQSVPRLVVALAKADTVPDSATVTATIRARLATTSYANAPIVPVSAPTGHGLGALRRALAETLTQAPPQPDHAKPRLFIDRVFTRPGLGTIVTGTLTGGSLHVGDPVVAEPGSRPTRLRTLHNHNRPADAAHPGSRIAANLPDIDAATLHRGHVLTSAPTAGASTIFDVHLTRLPAAERPHAARLLRSPLRVRLQLHTADLPATLLLLDTPALATGHAALAQLRLDTPTLAFLGDCFVLRDWSKRTTLAGGRILALDPPRTRLRRPDRLAHLAYLAAALDDPAALVTAALPADGSTDAATFLARSPHSAAHLTAALAGSPHVVQRRGLLARRAFYDRLFAAARATLADFHAAHPELAGMPLPAWRAALAPHAKCPALLDALLDDLTRSAAPDAVLDAQTFRLATHAPSVPAYLAEPVRRLRAVLARDPFAPPSGNDLAPDLRSQQALRHLLDTGEAIDLGNRIVLLHTALNAATAQIVAHLQTHRGATVSQLKTLLASSRRIMVPLLERLDRTGVTRRVGDVRVLATPGINDPHHSTACTCGASSPAKETTHAR